MPALFTAARTSAMRRKTTPQPVRAGGCRKKIRGASIPKAGAVVRPAPSVRERIKVELAYFLEWLLCRIRPGSGEEIVLQARRPT